jgi:hypothetical protein
MKMKIDPEALFLHAIFTFSERLYKSFLSVDTPVRNTRKFPSLLCDYSPRMKQAKGSSSCTDVQKSEGSKCDRNGLQTPAKTILPSSDLDAASTLSRAAWCVR